MDETALLDAQWRAWFDAQEISPLRVRYHELAENPAAALARLLDQTGQDAELAIGITPQVQRLSDARNRDWAARFLAGE